MSQKCTRLKPGRWRSAASAIGVLVRFALEKYLDSDLYVGQSEAGAKMPANDE